MKIFTKRLFEITLTLLLLVTLNQNAAALTGVNPTGVNVRTHGVTTVFLTFQGTAGQTSTDAFWCGEITVPANTVTSTNPCVAGTLFGFLPKRLNLARNSGTGEESNVTDIMTIPSSVSRRAFQDAKAGNKSSFFYVRRFSGPTGDQFVAVTCRMAGGGARVPLALTNVDLVFRTDEGDKPVTLISQNNPAPKVGAAINYNGSGRLKGRWEIVQPGDPEPTATDLLSEASLPIEQRGLQNQYTLLERFNVFLPPTGRAFITGPKVNKIPTTVRGPYKILFRVEASFDKEGNSNTLSGVTQSGGVAGFSMPVLRYYVASENDVEKANLKVATQQRVNLMSPLDNKVMNKNQRVAFKWQQLIGAKYYQLQVKDNTNEIVLSAVLKSNQTSYLSPPWLSKHSDKPLRWRVISKINQDSNSGTSEWRKLTLN